MLEQWNQSINIKKYFANQSLPDDSFLPDNIRQGIRSELNKINTNRLEFCDADDLTELKEELEDKEAVETVYDFDCWLDEFYNWADRVRVWCG